MSFSGNPAPFFLAEATIPKTFSDRMGPKRNEHARAGIRNYVIKHRREVGGEFEGSVVEGSLHPFDKKGIGEMVARRKNGAGMTGLRNETMKTILSGFYNRPVFPGREVLECLVLSELCLTAGGFLNGKAMNYRVKKLHRSKWSQRNELLREKRVAKLGRTLQGYESRSWKESLGVENRRSIGDRESLEASLLVTNWCEREKNKTEMCLKLNGGLICKKVQK